MQKFEKINEKIHYVLNTALKNQAAAGLDLSSITLEVVEYLQLLEQKAKALADEVAKLRAENEEFKKAKKYDAVLEAEVTHE